MYFDKWQAERGGRIHGDSRFLTVSEQTISITWDTERTAGPVWEGRIWMSRQCEGPGDPWQRFIGVGCPESEIPSWRHISMARSGKEACVLGPIGLDDPELPGLGFSTKHLEKKRNYLECPYPTPAEIQGLCLHNPEGHNYLERQIWAACQLAGYMLNSFSHSGAHQTLPQHPWSWTESEKG